MYKPVITDFWNGRDDGPGSLRWHQLVQCIDPDREKLPELKDGQRGFAFMGFRSDEGVKRNQGRPGAKEGPGVIRKACMNFACHFDPETTLLIDAGDISCESTRLEEAQEELAQWVSLLIDNNYFPLILGGGHEVSFGGYKGVFQAKQYEKLSLGIVNFDAHFDLRSYEEQASSGTPFLQIAGICETHKKKFRYMCLGIQPHSNTEVLFKQANTLGVEYILGNNIREQALPSIEHALINFLNRSDRIYLTIDMDVFDGKDAPGVSAPAVPGTDRDMIFLLLGLLAASGKLAAFDIAETNPAFDRDERTAKLAAHLIYRIVNTQARS